MRNNRIKKNNVRKATLIPSGVRINGFLEQRIREICNKYDIYAQPKFV